MLWLSSTGIAAGASLIWHVSYLCTDRVLCYPCPTHWGNINVDKRTAAISWWSIRLSILRGLIHLESHLSVDYKHSGTGRYSWES